VAAAGKVSEPKLVMRPEERAVLEQLRRFEPIFHRQESGSSRAQLEAMTAEDFWEIGASGRRYSRAFVLDTVAARPEDPVEEDDWETSDFHCRRLAADLYLLTYTLLQGGERLTRRATIWQRKGAAWCAVFHQGTIVQE
jgi:hypothetical protein